MVNIDILGCLNELNITYYHVGFKEWKTIHDTVAPNAEKLTTNRQTDRPIDGFVATENRKGRTKKVKVGLGQSRRWR